jgi:hypothetical protein
MLLATVLMQATYDVDAKRSEQGILTRLHSFDNTGCGVVYTAGVGVCLVCDRRRRVLCLNCDVFELVEVMDTTSGELRARFCPAVLPRVLQRTKPRSTVSLEKRCDACVITRHSSQRAERTCHITKIEDRGQHARGTSFAADKATITACRCRGIIVTRMVAGDVLVSGFY